jgi:hypothetical protein
MDLGYTNIYILDNNSTYPPLLQWYKEMDECHINGRPIITVVRIGSNSGQLALWNTGYIDNFKYEPYIVYTDSDIEINGNSKSGFIEEMCQISAKNKGIKVGLALNIFDLPSTELGSRVRQHEIQFWNNKVDENSIVGNILYQSDVDTTFAVIDPKEPFTYRAIRVSGNFTAKHIPWYTDWANMTEEEQYVLDHLNSHHSTYKGYYLQWLEKQKANN